MPSIGHFQIRNRGTIGGSIVHADPAAELPALCITLKAEFVLRSAMRQRTIGAADFFRTYLTTTIEPVEMLTEIRFPLASRWRWGFDEVAVDRGTLPWSAPWFCCPWIATSMCQVARLIMFGVGAPRCDAEGRGDVGRTTLDGPVLISSRVSWRPNWSRIGIQARRVSPRGRRGGRPQGSRDGSRQRQERRRAMTAKQTIQLTVNGRAYERTVEVRLTWSTFCATSWIRHALSAANMACAARARSF